jgi:hypothetical protein
MEKGLKEVRMSCIAKNKLKRQLRGLRGPIIKQANAQAIRRAKEG